MGFTQVHTDLMFSALDCFLEDDSPIRIFRNELGISFETALGNYGLIVPNQGGNWDILINEIPVYEIEEEVFSIITHEGNAPSIDVYMEKLNQAYLSPLKEKSKKFVVMTKKGIEFLALHGKINLAESFIHGPFFVYTSKQGIKERIILN